MKQEKSKSQIKKEKAKLHNLHRIEAIEAEKIRKEEMRNNVNYPRKMNPWFPLMLTIAADKGLLK